MISHSHKNDPHREPMADLGSQVRCAMNQSGFSALRAVHCHVEDGIVELQGNVPSFYLKQMAQCALQRVRGVRGIRNCLTVTREDFGNRDG